MIGHTVKPPLKGVSHHPDLNTMLPRFQSRRQSSSELLYQKNKKKKKKAERSAIIVQKKTLF